MLGLLLLLTVALMSVCGQSANTKSADPSAAATASASSAAPSETPKPTDAQAPKATTKIVSTIKGDVEIPVEPKRIVALYYHHILLGLDIKPVGANLTWWGGSPFLQQLEADGITDVGGPPSLEAVAKLEPDLIIMNDNNAEDYEQFSKIAPSVLLPYDANRSVYEDAKLIGDLLGISEAAQQLTERFEAKAAEARAKIAGVVDENAKVAIIRIEGKGSEFSVFGDNYGRGGWAVYRGFRFQAPNKVRQLMASGRQVEQKIPLRLLADYTAEADPLFVTLIDEKRGHVSPEGAERWPLQS
jgi:iron complex transport system substrate-binding protein